MIDLCVTLVGPHVEVMLPFFLDSLYEKTDMSDFKLHLVTRNCSEAVKKFVHDYSVGKNIVCYDNSEEHLTSHRLSKNHYEMNHDANENVKFMMEVCGSEEWMAVMHFDVELHKDWLNYYKSLISPEVGMIGDGITGLQFIRREAYRQCWVGFRAFSWDHTGGFFLCKDHYGNWRLRAGSDPRCDSKAVHVFAWDASELFELNIQERGWKLITFTDIKLNEFRYHLGTGSGHTGNMYNKRQEALDVLKRRGLKEIE